MEPKEGALRRAIDVIDKKGGEITVINLKLTILEQKALLSEIRADLLERAETDSQGLKVVGLGDGLWQKLKRHLGE